MSSEGDEEKERATNTDCGKEEWRAGVYNKEGGTVCSVGSNFHFFHLFAPLTVVLKKVPWRYQIAIGGFSSGLLVHWISLLIEWILSLISLFLAPFLRSLFRTSLSNTYGPFCSLSPRVLSPFLGLSPPRRTISFSSNPSDTSGHGRSPYVTDTIPLE